MAYFKTVFDPDFKYRSSVATDVRLTFERIRRDQRKEERLAEIEQPRVEKTPPGPQFSL